MSEQKVDAMTNADEAMAVLLASLDGNGEYLNDLEKSCLRQVLAIIARLTAIVDAIDLAGSGAQVSEFMESFPSVRRVVDLRAECDMASRETARLLTVNSESNAVCSCGCELVDHEERGEDGWSCDNESHECVPTSAAVAQMLRQRESALAAQRQSITALREWLDDTVHVTSVRQMIKTKMDSLGLLPAATAGEK